MTLRIQQLAPDNTSDAHALLDVFADAFNDRETYGHDRPAATYLQRLFGAGDVIALVALLDSACIGGLVAYQFKKIEQQRSEIYLYDLAVAEKHRRQGIATALIDALKNVAAVRGAYVIFVQADIGDEPAIALYTKLGLREEVLHFDIAVPGREDQGVT